MSRTVSSNFQAEVFAQESDDALVLLMTITHPDFPGDPARISNHNTTLVDAETAKYGTISRGNTYLYLPMEATLPEEGEDSQPMMQISVDNVTRDLIPILRSVTTPATVTIELVLASTPNVVEIIWPQFQLRGAEWDATRVTLSLQVDAMISEPYPGDDFTPSKFGGLWSTT